jgi:hypothetical protein|tara:strand:- start:513 stop:974 length:462 start_codon:yes stop_codon:yes gene_type:complete
MIDELEKMSKLLQESADRTTRVIEIAEELEIQKKKLQDKLTAIGCYLVDCDPDTEQLTIERVIMNIMDRFELRSELLAIEESIFNEGVKHGIDQTVEVNTPHVEAKDAKIKKLEAEKAFILADFHKVLVTETDIHCDNTAKCYLEELLKKANK